MDKSKSNEFNRAELKDLNVLVVDDVEVIRKSLSSFLKKIGATVFEASSGEDALTIYSQEKIDFVILDVMMPEMDGHSVCVEIRRMDGGQQWTPIIFLTSLEGEEAIVQCVDAGGDDILHKPFSKSILLAKMHVMRRIANQRRKLIDANAELVRLASTDSLTLLHNRRGFDHSILKEWRRTIRGKQEMSLIMIDIDRFKNFNDSFGHRAGDDCLKKIGHILIDICHRPGDVACRYGGEEFGLILPETSLEGAINVAERARKKISESEIFHLDQCLGFITASFGCSSSNGFLSIEEMIEAADQALYEAKKTRNTIEIYKKK